MASRSPIRHDGREGSRRDEWWGPADERRRRRRETSEQLVALFDHLPPQDAALLRAVYVDGKRIRQLAAIVDIPAKSLGTRLQRLIRRVRTPLFSFVAHQSPLWTHDRRRVAQAVVLHGRPLRETCRELQLSLHAVRQHLASIQATFEAAHLLRHELAGAVHKPVDE